MDRRAFFRLAGFGALSGMTVAANAEPVRLSPHFYCRPSGVPGSFPHGESWEGIPNKFRVIGVGGFGTDICANAAGLLSRKVPNLEFISIDSDTPSPSNVNVGRHIQLGHRHIRENGTQKIAWNLAKTERDQIVEALAGAHMVIITAGMGGDTGSALAPMVAEISRDHGALTVAAVTMPFSFEASQTHIAEGGLAALRSNADAVIAMRNDSLVLDLLSKQVSLRESLTTTHNVPSQLIIGIMEMIDIPGLVGIDFEDVRCVMSEGGIVMTGSGKANGSNRARNAAEQALVSPLLEGADLLTARGLLVHIRGSESLGMRDTKDVMFTIRDHVANDATLIFATSFDDSMGDNLKVTLVATKLGGKHKPLSFREHALEERASGLLHTSRAS